MSNKIYLTRYLSLPYDRKSLKIDSNKLVVLVVASYESGLDVNREWHEIESVFSDKKYANVTSIIRLEKVSFQGLQEISLSLKPNVIHFIGHGYFNEDQGIAYIQFKNRDGVVEDISAEDLAYALGTMESLKLLVLNSCSGSLTMPAEIYKGMTHKLLMHGLPSIISMQKNINDSAAIAFSKQLYRCLINSLPLELAVTEARKSIRNAYGMDDNWYYPVLYTRSKNNLLFDFSKYDSYLDIYRENKKKVSLLLICFFILVFSFSYFLKNHIYRISEIVVYDKYHEPLVNAEVTVHGASFSGRKDFIGITNEYGSVSIPFLLSRGSSFKASIKKEGFISKEFLLLSGANVNERVYKKIRK